MSTNQDEQKTSDNVVVDQTNPEPVQSQEAGESKTPASSPARKILIGSQRDEADPELKSRAIRSASFSPAQLGTAIQPGETTEVADQTAEVTPPDTHQGAESPEPDRSAEPSAVATSTVSTETISETDVAETTPPSTSLPVEPIAAEASTDDELEAALSELQMDSLLESQQPEEELELESRIRALVTRLHNDNVFFSLKGRFEGVASKRQFKTPPEEGDMMDVVVRGFKEDEGLYEVSIPGAAVSVADWSDLAEGAIIETKITGSNTGGLECNVNNIRGFIPASQIDIVRVENFGEYVNKKLQCVVTEVNPRKKKLVLSRRAILEREKQEKKKELLATLEVGQTLEGIVTKLMDFGAFVDIGGVEGLVHVSKMSWERVNHPSEVLETGQKISVKIEKISHETGKISLSIRDTQENPWSQIGQKYPEGSVVEGTVSRLAQFGAFVKLEPGVEGLVHISELAHHRVIAVKNVVKQGDAVQVKVLSVDPQAQKIGLSLKATLAKPERTGDKKSAEEANEPIREAAIKKRSEPLKGGRDRGSGGESVGLNW